MLKDILVHLAAGISDDATIDYAISAALTFEAHLAGAAFADDGLLKPLSFRTNCSDAARISSSVAGG